MQRLKNWISAALVVSAVLSAPVALGAYLINAASGAAAVPVAVSSRESQDTTAGAPIVPLVAGVLYTNGPVKVNWHGVPIRVENSSYAYTGGELVATPPGAMGILRLHGGNTVFICPNSQVRVSRDASGGYALDVVDGSSRFMFDANTPFAVRVNDIVMTPDTAVPPPQDPAQTSMFAGEAQAEKDGGCLLCGLQNGVQISAPGLTPGARPVAAGAGQIVSVPGPQKRGKTTMTAAPAGVPTGEGEASGVTRIAIPKDVFSTMAASASAGGGARGVGYLCKCQKLKEYAEQAAQQLAQRAAEDSASSDASGDGDAAQADAGAPAGPDGSSTPAAPDPAPAVTPPPVPGLVVAESGPPDPFVPGLSPAAGDGSESGGPPPALDTPIIVPPPLIPGSGPGGGGVVSPS